MNFTLVDRVLERTEDSIVTIKHVSAAEEYLQDHFPSFPVLPGVMMLEAMTQAARELLDPEEREERPWVLGKVRALKYGAFVRPGATIRASLTVRSRNDDGTVEFQGEVHLLEPDAGGGETPVACAGRLTMRPAVL